MNRLFKLVALCVGVALLGSPLLALANCNPKFATSGRCGGEDCPMMSRSRQTASAHVSEVPSSDHSCCRIAGLPESAVKPAAIHGKSSVEPFAVQNVTAVVPVVFFQLKALPVPVLASSRSLQAVLCTFLV